MDWTIREIVDRFFSDVPDYPAGDLAGWERPKGTNEYFVEPSLTQTVSDAGARIWLFSAPGAVGKSTYARELAAAAGAVYIDLSQTGAIGANFLTGGLQKANLAHAVANRAVALNIDALDEAYLRVTFDSIENFIDDVMYSASGTAYPLFLYGRPTAIEWAQLILETKGCPINLLNIDYFTRDQAIRFILNYISLKSGDKNIDGTNNGILLERINEILNSLERTDKANDRSFSGYAPVLEAIAQFLVDDSNYAHSPTSDFGTLKDDLLERICRKILEREEEKVATAVSKITSSPVKMYSPEQQMEALCLICEGIPAESIPFKIESDDKSLLERCEKIAREFIASHPFLQRDGKPANAAFAGAIQSYALKHHLDDQNLLNTANISPLLAEFYFNDDIIYENIDSKTRKKLAAQPIPLSHVPFILKSLRNFLPSGYELSCTLEDTEEVTGAGEGAIEASISLLKKTDNSEKELRHFHASNDGPLVFHREMPCELAVFCPNITIKFQGDPDFSFVYPLNLEVAEVIFACQKLILVNTVLQIQSDKEAGNTDIKIKKMGHAAGYIAWPGSTSWPWSQFTQKEIVDEGNDKTIGKAFNALCRIALTFQANKNKSIAKLRDKIDNRRISGNFGKKIKQHMLDHKILTIRGHLYEMDTQKFAEMYDLSFDDISRRKISEKARNELRKILER